MPSHQNSITLPPTPGAFKMARGYTPAKQVVDPNIRSGGTPGNRGQAETDKPQEFVHWRIL
jgi:hypothetical protein